MTKMRIIGKFMLFFSSYFILFIVLFIREFPHINTSNIKTTPIPVFVSLGLYGILILCSIMSLYLFKMNYAFGSSRTNKRINISSISDGSSEIISYLVTMVLPLASTESLSSIISSNSWFKPITMIIIIAFISILYINSHLIVINPLLIVAGCSIHKISYNYNQNRNICIKGVLLSTQNINIESIPAQILVDKLDTNIFMYRRI